MENNTETMNNNYVLAMYDVRGKQNYIFRNNRLKEIIGASAIVRDVFTTYLYDSAKQYRDSLQGYDKSKTAIYNLRSCNEEKKKADDFEQEKFENRMKENTYVGEMIYDGGGNFFVLYKNKETYIEINKIFTKKVIEKTQTLKVLSSYIEGVNFSDYKGDRKKLYEYHNIVSGKSNFEVPSLVLPFIQVDNITSLPLSKRTTEIQEDENKVSYESYAKYEKFNELRRNNNAIDHNLIQGEKFLDKLVEKKGEESLLAIVYIDGNNMGASVQKCIEKSESYEDCIRELRKFSEEIQTNFVENGIKAINNRLVEKYSKDKYENERRIVVFAGDEINFIVNARDAYDAVEAYFDSLKKIKDGDSTKRYSACAGISIFHSHAPYSDAYRIAEECCETGKTRMKKNKSNYAFYVDYQYNQSAIGLDLDNIRERDNDLDISKPWLYDGDVDELYTTDLVRKMADELNKLGRGNVKTLINAAKKSQNEFDMELKRIIAHSDEKLDFSIGGILEENNQKRKLIYDVGIVYDLWFIEETSYESVK